MSDENKKWTVWIFQLRPKRSRYGSTRSFLFGGGNGDVSEILEVLLTTGDVMGLVLRQMTAN